MRIVDKRIVSNTPFFGFLIFIIWVTVFSSCSNDDKARQVAAEQALKSSESSAETNLPVPFIPVVVGSLSVKAPKLTASKGQEICVPISTAGFINIVSMQYAIEWDPGVLKFKEVRSFGLPGLGDSNFGVHKASDGLLTHSWFDQNVKGVDLKDNAVLYEVCFEAIGAPGTKSPFRFTEDPVIFEVTNPESNYLQLKPVDGSVSIN